MTLNTQTRVAGTPAAGWLLLSSEVVMYVGIDGVIRATDLRGDETRF